MKQAKAGLLLNNGLTLIEHVYRVLSRICARIVLVGHGQGVPETLKDVTLVKDNYPGCGPIAGLEALLSSQIDTEYLIVPCDLFKINQEVLQWLSRVDARFPVVLKHGDWIEPLVGRYSIDILDLARRQIAQKKMAMHDLVMSANGTLLEVPSEFIPFLANANTPQDLNE